MSEMMSYCGLLCNECPAYIATTTNDENLRRSTANEWSVMYAADIPPEAINCLGCRSDTRIGYSYACEIRKCATDRKVDNCGLCNDFACSLLEPIFISSPESKARLEKAK